MEKNIDIKDLWGKQQVPIVNQAGISKEIENFKKQGVKKSIILSLILGLTILCIAFIWIYFKPQLISTQIGIVLTILPIGIVILFNCKIIPFYKKLNESSSNLDYLNDLLFIKNKEHFMQTKLMSLYFILLSTGIVLYMYEYTLNMSSTVKVSVYAGVFLWFGFNWFYLRPTIIKKNKRKIDHLISQITKVKSQLEDSYYRS